MVTVKSKLCFGSGQFVGGAKTLHNQCAVDSNLPAKKFVNKTNLAREFWKKCWSNAANCSEIYTIS